MEQFSISRKFRKTRKFFENQVLSKAIKYQDFLASKKNQGEKKIFKSDVRFRMYEKVLNDEISKISYHLAERADLNYSKFLDLHNLLVRFSFLYVMPRAKKHQSDESTKFVSSRELRALKSLLKKSNQTLEILRGYVKSESKRDLAGSALEKIYPIAQMESAVLSLGRQIKNWILQFEYLEEGKSFQEMVQELHVLLKDELAEEFLKNFVPDLSKIKSILFYVQKGYGIEIEHEKQKISDETLQRYIEQSRMNLGMMRKLGTRKNRKIKS